jgi:hypothetical protein
MKQLKFQFTDKGTKKQCQDIWRCLVMENNEMCGFLLRLIKMGVLYLSEL